MKIRSEVSIIIPAYNRAWCVGRAVESAVRFVGESNEAEIVLVDDGSADSTLAVIQDVVRENRRHANISFRICTHSENRGVCAAKNTGARAASGAWLVFFDSDDELMPDGLDLLRSCLSQAREEKIHFFMSIDERTMFDPAAGNTIERRDLRKYLMNGVGGERLPVIEREAFLRFPYDEDVRGYESLAYMRLVKNYRFLAVHSLGLRRYHTSNDDRLSTKVNMRKRRPDLITGHLRALREHYKQAPVLWSVKQAMRAMYTLVR